MRPGLLLLVAIFVVACSGGGGGSDGGGDEGGGDGVFRARAVAVADEGMIFFLDSSNMQITRWSMLEDRFLSPIELAESPRIGSDLVYSRAHDRLYVGRDGGSITRVDAPSGEAPVELPFVTASAFRSGMTAAGDFLVASAAGSQNELLSLRANGTVASTITGYAAGEMAFRESTSQVIGFGTNSRVHRVEVDAVTGALRNVAVGPNREGHTYYGSIFVSPTGSDIVLGSGPVVGATLETIDQLPKAFHHATYLADGTLLTIRDPFRDDEDDEDAPETTILERWSSDRELIDAKQFDGWPVAVAAAGGEVTVVTTFDSHRSAFSPYTPGVDGDGDGVPYSNDDFPLDRAASLDSDGDGAPDAWNPGESAGSSSTGLSRDAFPQDSACQSRGQALDDDRTRCDVAGSIPGYFPASVTVDDDGIIYVLSREERRIFRWSATEERHLNPIPIGEGASRIVHSSAHGRLYVAYSRGAVSQIDLSGVADTPREDSVVRFPGSVQGLFEAGSFLIQSGGGGPQTLGVFDGARNRVGSGVGYGTALGEYVVGDHRLYHLRPTTQGAWSYAYATEIDPGTGAVLGTSQLVQGVWEARPAVSSDGMRIALDDGEVRDTDTLALRDRLPLDFADARWLPDGRLVVIGNGGDRRIVMVDENCRPVDGAPLGGLPVALVEAAGRLIVIVQPTGTSGPLPVIYQRYVPGTDGDGDGVPFDIDADPLDAAVSVDSDADGFPDHWNDGHTGSANGGHFSLDAFPFDSACQVAEHAAAGDADVCDDARRSFAGRPDGYAMDVRGIVHLLKRDHNRIFRYSLVEDRWVDPILFYPGVRSIGYSAAHDQLYIGWESGLIERVDASTPTSGRRYFKTVERYVESITESGEFVIAVSGGSPQSYDVLAADGTTVSSIEDSYGALPPELVGAADRLYHVHDVSSPRRLHWLGLDAETGVFGSAEDERSYYDDELALPLRMSLDGRWAAFATGLVFDAETFDYDFELPVTYTDALWQADGGIVTLRDPGDGSSRVELWGPDFELDATESFTGEPLRILASAGRLGIVRLVDGRPTVSLYSPSNDSDADGVVNSQDGFPLDPSASIDTDSDGAPDSWNPGRGPADSTQGLVLDAFPNDDACQLPEHGRASDPSICDIAFGIPPYTPDDVVLSADGIVYALSPENRRIYRWSIDEQYHLDPIPIGRDVDHLALSDASQKLYLAYDDGQLTSIDLGDPTLVESDFASVTSYPTGLQVIETTVLVVARVEQSTAVRHVVFDADGDLLVDNPFRDHASDLAWCPINQTLYFLRGISSAEGLLAETVDPTTGALGEKQYGPFLSAADFANPIRVSKNGATIAIGSGRFFDGATLALLGTLPTAFVDGRWLSDGTLLTVRDAGDGQTTLERWTAGRALLETATRDGVPLRLLESAAGVVLVTNVDGDPTYQMVE